MPKQSDFPCFAIFCEDRELDRHLGVCENSGFSVVKDNTLGRVTVQDAQTMVLDATRITGCWLVRLHVQFYRHPFGPFSNGNAPPGVC